MTLAWLAIKLLARRLWKAIAAALELLLKFTISPIGGITFATLSIALAFLLLDARSDAAAAMKQAGKLRAQIAQMDAKAVKAAKDLAAAEAALRVRQTQVTTQVEQKTAARAVQIRTVTQKIIKEVPVYVTAKADAACTVPAGFVRLHDDAATGRISQPSGVADDAPSGLALSAVGRTIAANYGQCSELANQLTGLQTWVREQARLFGKP